MATQIGVTKTMTSIDEPTRANLTDCPNCRTKVVPRGITTTRKDDLSVGEKKCCPYCGHVFGHNSLLSRKVRHIAVTGAGGATITVDNGTKQMTATITPDYADNKAVTWSTIAGTGTASISESGVVTAITNGTVKVVATAQDGSGMVGFVTLTLSNQT